MVMVDNRIKVLMIVEQCNPDWASVPLEGYNYFSEISKLADVTLVTHERNREALEKLPEKHKIVYMPENIWLKKYYKFVEKIATNGKINWPLYHALTYPLYAEFNHNVYQKFKGEIRAREYDLVHALTPMMPRYPVKSIEACQQTPFLLGPVNGGVPFPPGFQETAKKENANLNFLRAWGRFLIPGYRATYQKANKVLAGSTYTLNLIKKLFAIADENIELFYENGILPSFVTIAEKPKHDDKINLLFVGRLVPYKCADVVVEAIHRLDSETQGKIQFTIVGGGEEEQNLREQVQQLNLSNIVHFAGWIPQKETIRYYHQSDIFCFPSIREFGGAVVLEAMASGLTCIVANNGGIGEYVTEDNGFKIEPLSREYLTQEVAEKIKILVQDCKLRERLSANAIERAKEFTWPNKAQKMVGIYEKLTASSIRV